MAIISIPTSIGGVTIPGALVDGPLGALFGNKYGLNNLKYPRDLESATRGHIVQFTIQEINPVTYSDVKNAVARATDDITGTFNNIKNTVTDFVDNFGDGTFTTSNLSFMQPETTNVGTISLYIPDTMAFTYGMQYTDPSLLQIGADALSSAAGVIGGKAGKIAGSVVQNVTSAVTSDATKLAMRKAGYALNPQQQLLFQGIGFRTYQMTFTFTPNSRDEADQVDKIIKMFKKHASPRLVTGTGGMFFVPPSQFEIKFLFNGTENKKINRIAKSVIETIDVNYAPNGWTAHTDGAPVQTQLNINFKEMVLLDRNMIDQGY